MGVQRFYLPNGREYIEYSVEDVDYDYANVVIAPIDETLAVGVGYILREEVVVGISMDTDETTTMKRWFAYDAGTCTGCPGVRVGNVNAGYSTMENAIAALLREYAETADAIKKDADGDSQNLLMPEEYDPYPIDVTVWSDTGRDGTISSDLSDRIAQAGGIHMVTASLMQNIVRHVSKSLWAHHDLFGNDGITANMTVSVDVPTDVLGNRVPDESKPFDGMSLGISLVPSARSSICQRGTVSISVIDVEDAEDATVLIGTSVVSNEQGTSTEDDLGMAIMVDSFSSEATSPESVEFFANRIMSEFLNNFMRGMIATYQSMLRFMRDPYDEDGTANDNHMTFV